MKDSIKLYSIHHAACLFVCVRVFVCVCVCVCPSMKVGNTDGGYCCFVCGKERHDRLKRPN
jgi:hypothetical protein